MDGLARPLEPGSGVYKAHPSLRATSLDRAMTWTFLEVRTPKANS